MKKMTIIVLVTVAMVFILAFSIWKKNAGGKDITVDIPYGPFIIRAQSHTGKAFDMNYGMVSQTDVRYAVLYRGKPVVFPASLQTNTGLPFLWRVYVLTDVPKPTLLAGSQSLYLIYEQDGEVVLEPLNEQGTDFASVQFLDSQDGQPGIYQEVFMKNDTRNLDKLDTLKGGRFLMLSEHVVLDLQTLKSWSFNLNNHSVDNYSFPQPHGAIAFSPDRKRIVFNGGFQSWNTETADLPDSEHALVVYNFQQDSGYIVPYDDTDTRLTNISNINIAWMNTYFEWLKQDDGTDRLSLKVLAKLPEWTGSYDESDHYYTLYPVKPGMTEVLLDFVLQEMSWTKANILKEEYHEYTGRRIYLVDGAVKLDICYREDEQQLTLSKHLYDAENAASQALVKKLADDFNAVLLSGKHQELFGRILSETKRIRGGYE